MVINFCQFSIHKRDTIGKLIESPLFRWGIDMTFIITVDRVSLHDLDVFYLKTS